MTLIRFTLLTAASLLCWSLALITAAADLVVVGTSPAARGLTASPSGAISIEFDQPVDITTIGPASFHAFGRWSGPVMGRYTFSNGDRTVSLHPDAPLSYGEQVMVVLSHDIQGVSGDGLRSAGYSFQFWTRAAHANKTFALTQSLTTRTNQNQNTRSYGGLATDLNNDGFCDVTIVNEDVDDMRVFMNSADGLGTLDTFLEPTVPTGDTPSPSEAADFNADGFADICVANTTGSSVSVLLGNGDGTFGAQQVIGVGATPRGIATLDVDGDGDVDIVNTNASTSNMSVLLNDGTGQFGSATFFEGGGAGEWSLAVGDMNEDGILDLVIGARSGQEILINLGNGDGTFTHFSTQSAAGRPWMLNCSDVNGDGHEDVTAANSSFNNAAVLFGDGNGSLSAPQTYPTDPFPLATDLGDVDGDGDLDWLLSSFQGDFFLFENDGQGVFTFLEEFPAMRAASCALMVDLDNDADLDLALIDELADLVEIYINSGTSARAALIDVTRTLGIYVSGGVTDLIASDDTYYVLQSGPGFDPTEPHPARADFAFDTGGVMAKTLDVTLEENANIGGPTAVLLLRNWNTGQWDELDRFGLTPTDQTFVTTSIAASDYINGSGRIELRARSFAILILNPLVRAFFNHDYVGVDMND